MRRAFLVLIVAGFAGCSSAPPKPPFNNSETRAPQRLADADALLRAGCYDCLLDAYRAYDAERALPFFAGTATLGAARAATLLALRERELGTADSGYVATARSLLNGLPGLSPTLSRILEIVDALPWRVGFQRAPATDTQLEQSRILRENISTWTAWLREEAPKDFVSAYAWLSMLCGSVDGRRMTAEQHDGARAGVARRAVDPAIAFFNLERKAEAREYAEKVSTDEQFGERARDLLSRLK